MDKDFESFISSRCEEKLQKNREYIEIQKKMADAQSHNKMDDYSELSLRLQLIVQNECYKYAFKDILMVLINA